MRAGPAALCPGTVWHRRHRPSEHRFRYPTAQVWVNPDHPEELCDLSPLWSHRRSAIVRFRPTDYGRTGTDLSLSEQVRRDLEPGLGRRPTGPVRMLSQLRRWGWLFNPLTVFLAWDDDPDRPVGAVLEVTNTPWKQRHRYAVPLEADDRSWRASFPKQLHVSPFLDNDFTYDLRIDDSDDQFRIALDVIAPDGESTVSTLLDARREHAARRSVTRSTFTTLAPTHRVSLGIHLQALRLWLKRVPFVANQRQRQPMERVAP